MKPDDDFSSAAIRGGAITGSIAVALYLTWSVMPLPDGVNLIAHFAFGPLLVASFIGIHFFLQRHGKWFMNLVAAAYGAAGGIAFTFMTVVQAAMLRRLLPEYTEATVEGAKQTARAAVQAANTVQLGMDVVWDVYITLATVLVAWSLIRRGGGVRIFGGIGFVLGAATLVLNLWTFPVPPADAGLVDLGPFVGLFFAGVCMVMFRDR